MLLKPNTDVTTGSIVDANGEIANKPTILLSSDDAKLLRDYKKFLMRMGLREALYCNECWTGDRHDGCKAFVTDAQIGIFCRCRMRFHQGHSF